LCGRVVAQPESSTALAIKSQSLEWLSLTDW